MPMYLMLCMYVIVLYCRMYGVLYGVLYELSCGVEFVY